MGADLMTSKNGVRATSRNSQYENPPNTSKWGDLSSFLRSLGSFRTVYYRGQERCVSASTRKSATSDNGYSFPKKTHMGKKLHGYLS